MEKVNMIPDSSNALFNIAADLVNHSSRNIFLTGNAGTGKTTFLKHIRENCSKQIAVVAPTGVAAINAGGVTIHSFFQLPFAPFIPELQPFSQQQDINSRNSLVSRLRINSEKKKILRELELLIIDEISMVRCDTLDAIDTVLRFIRQRPLERFGGVQVLFIGDMFQLPPVIKDQEWRLLSSCYNSPYFFESLVIKEEPPVYIEFTKIYRQTDERFIRLLNQVRNNQVDAAGRELLDSRFQPEFSYNKEEGVIILTTHNEKARNINTTELAKIDKKLYSYKSEIENDFSENAYPADELLQLKVGAQVMFIKNDTAERGKRFFNGKIGIVSNLEKEKIFVQCKGEPDEIEVKKEKWENIRYSLNKTSRNLEEEVLGSFTQFPLRLAWAITIHKSQGLTFEKAIIDAGAAFAPGQVYVALSRCTSLDGIVLQSRLQSSSLNNDSRIVAFSQRNNSAEHLEKELEASRRVYEQKIWISSFDFQNAITTTKELQQFVCEYASSFNPETLNWIENLLQKLAAVQGTAAKFHVWLNAQFQLPEALNQNIVLKEKTKSGSIHFINELENSIQLLKQSPAITDSRMHAKEYNENIKEIFAQLAIKKQLLAAFSNGFNLEEWQKLKREFVLPYFSVNAYAGAAQKQTNSPHPLLHQQLRKLRDTICERKNLPIYIVAGSKTLDEMAEFLPQNLDELAKINGFGPAKLNAYGEQFLTIIRQYCVENNLESRLTEKIQSRKKTENKSEAKAPKIDTKAESFRLFKEGKTVADIARERNLIPQTIEGHLAHYVSRGEIPIEKLIGMEKVSLIEPFIKNFEAGSITPIKEQLGDAISFGEIRLVIAWNEFRKSRDLG